MQDAGADALELNLYHVAADPSQDRRRHGGARPRADRAPSARRSASRSPSSSARTTRRFAGFARRVVDAGADGLVLFNRFYQPDLDLETLDVVARLDLSRPSELRLPMRWIAILRPQLPAGRVAGGHVRHPRRHRRDQGPHGRRRRRDDDLGPAPLRPGHLRTVEAEIVAWMEEREYDSVGQLRGSASQATVEDPSAYERANYMDTLHSWATPDPGAPGVPVAPA